MEDDRSDSRGPIRGRGPGRLEPGRPKKLDKPWKKVTVVLTDEQIVFLDRRCADIRARTGKPMRRTELIRAFIDAIRNSEIDVTDNETEQEVAETLERALSDDS